MNLDEIASHIKTFAELEHGWYGPNAGLPFDPEFLDWAGKVAERFVVQGLPPVYVNPTLPNHVLIEWSWEPGHIKLMTSLQLKPDRTGEYYARDIGDGSSGNYDYWIGDLDESGILFVKEMLVNGYKRGILGHKQGQPH